MITNTTTFLILLAGGVMGGPLVLIAHFVTGDPAVVERTLHVFVAIWVFVVDLAIRTLQDEPWVKRFLHPNTGGHVFFIPAWIALPGLLLFLLISPH
jgi:hypothetical protein